MGFEIMACPPSAADQVPGADPSRRSCDSQSQSLPVNCVTHSASGARKSSSTTARKETQIAAENEGEDGRDALHFQDDGADASLQSHAGASIAQQSVGKEASGPDHSQVDLEKGVGAAEAELLGFESGEASGEYEEERKCRVCHLMFEVESGRSEAMQLGCHCKNDLSIAHRDCAEAWFKIKGNRICEICGATVQNIVGNEDPGFMDQWNERDADAMNEPQTRPSVQKAMPRRSDQMFWRTKGKLQRY